MTSRQLGRRVSSVASFLRDFLRNKEAAFGFFFLLILTLSAVFANYIFPVGPSDLLAYPALLPPSLAFPMGTDYIGRNMLMMMVFGARVSLFVAVGASALLALLGTVAGLLAGYLGGKMDGLIMRIADVFLTLPALPLILLVVAILGQSITNIMLIIALTSWPFMARLVRSNVLTMMKRDFIQIREGDGSRRATHRLQASASKPNRPHTGLHLTEHPRGGPHRSCGGVSRARPDHRQLGLHA